MLQQQGGTVTVQLQNEKEELSSATLTTSALDAPHSQFVAFIPSPVPHHNLQKK